MRIFRPEGIVSILTDHIFHFNIINMIKHIFTP